MWVPLALRGAVLGAGALLGLLAPPLVVVIVVAVAVLVAIGAEGLVRGAGRREATSRSARRRSSGRRPWRLSPPWPSSSASVFAVIALVGLVVLFFLLGGDLG